MIARVLLLTILVFAVSRSAAGDGLVLGDVWIALRAQELSHPILTWLTRVTNWLGQGAIPMISLSLVFVAVLFATRFRAEALLVLAASLGHLLNTPIKVLINSPRPTLDLVGVTEDAPGLGFPSGHAMGATLLFGALIIVIPAVVRRRWLAVVMQMLAVAVILVTGFGRIASGAHWPSDVLGGYLWGLLLLQPLGWLYHRYRWQLNLRRWLPGDERRVLGRGEHERPQTPA